MKSRIASKYLLNDKIRELEELQAKQLDDLKDSYAELLQTLKPTNIVGSAMKNVIGTPGLRTTLIDTIVSAGAGILGKKVVVRNSGNIFRKLAGLATQFLVTNLVRNKIPDLKEKSNGVHVSEIN